jgi:hypothetical protein
MRMSLNDPKNKPALRADIFFARMFFHGLSWRKCFLESDFQ